MKVLFVGDVVGLDAADWLAARLPALIRENKIDFTIVNGENMLLEPAERGVTSGMSKPHIDALFAAGADVITSGNHAWDGADAAALLQYDRVIRPLNVPKDWGGKGSITVDKNGERVTVVNLCDTDSIGKAEPLSGSWQPGPDMGTIFVDVHSGPNAKFTVAHAFDGQIAAVFGTHTHEATLRMHSLPRGTALVVEVGMTGRLGGNGGFSIGPAVARFRGEPAGAARPAFAPGELILGAVVATVTPGQPTALRRIE